MNDKSIEFAIHSRNITYYYELCKLNCPFKIDILEFNFNRRNKSFFESLLNILSYIFQVRSI